jgi:hypothetical protein
VDIAAWLQKLGLVAVADTLVRVSHLDMHIEGHGRARILDRAARRGLVRALRYPAP